MKTINNKSIKKIMSYKDRILNKRSTQYEIIKFIKLKIYN